MGSGQSSNERVTDNSVNEESSAYSVKLSSAHEKKLLALLTENGTYGRRSPIPRVTGIRALLELQKESVEFLGVVRMVLEQEKEQRRERRKGGSKEKAPSPVSVVLLPDQRSKMVMLTGFCLSNNLSCSAGTIVRALIESTEPSPEFTQYLRKVHDKERERWYMNRGLR